MHYKWLAKPAASQRTTVQHCTAWNTAWTLYRRLRKIVIGQLEVMRFHHLLRMSNPEALLLRTKLPQNLITPATAHVHKRTSYRVFESLNAKGKPLSQADLARNYLFMRLPKEEREEAYRKCWLPMYQQLSDSMSEFFRHFLILHRGAFVRESNVYGAMREYVENSNQPVSDVLKTLCKYAGYYDKIVRPEHETSPISGRLIRLNRLKFTTAYPVLNFDTLRGYWARQYRAYAFSMVSGDTSPSQTATRYLTENVSPDFNSNGSRWKFIVTLR